MAGYATAKKRQREAAKRERQQEKAARRAQRKQHEPRVPGAEGEDPDLAGIVAGPQPTKEENQ